MKKTIVFGAGLGGESYIMHNKNRNFIAISDNDKTLWNSTKYNIPVIAPEDINSIDFDEIIIASQWQDSIENQLINQLNIDPKKIKIPAKNELKSVEFPFRDPATLSFAHNALGAVTAFLDRHNIKAVVDSGTALGVVRDGDLIAWDDDIDLAINENEFIKMLDLIEELLKILPQSKFAKWEATIISLAGIEAAVNLDLISHNKDAIKNIEISLQKRVNIDGRSHLVSSAGLFDAPAIYFENPQKINFKNHQIYLPDDVENFLTFMYGNWREPKQNTTVQDYDNRHKLASDPASFQITKRKITL